MSQDASRTPPHTLLSVMRVYWRWLDQAGRRWETAALRRADARRAVRAYQALGVPAVTAKARRTAPTVVRERAATDVSRQWRRWIWVGMAVGTVAGSFGPVVGAGGFITVLYLWAADLAYVYGLDPQDAARQERLRRYIGEELQRAWGHRSWQGMARASRSGLRLLGYDLRLLAWADWGGAALALAGLGQERVWADRVMARVRGEWRAEAEAMG